jgi:excisionase family DNA binding protein
MITAEMPTNKAVNGAIVAGKPEGIKTQVAAEMIGVGVARVKQLLEEGKLQGYKVERGAWRVEIESVRRYLRYQEALEKAKKILTGEADD